MESFKRPGGRRVLFPAEVELCETVGITEDEYWYFVELTQAYNGKRPKEYDVLPYVINDFISTAITFLTSGTATANFVLGVILTVVSVVLAPKPRAPKTPPSLTTAGLTGPKRFAPQTGFNSVQELASLGEVVPLVFTKQEFDRDDRYHHGGVRINTRLLWSQMLSLGASQQLKALFMIGLGDLAANPDFAGYAIGDLLLKNYINKKIALYIKRSGGRPKETNKYSEGTLGRQKDRRGSVMHDVMSVDWDETLSKDDSIVSGTRTPNTQTQFGAYSPMPNAMRYRVPYELVLMQENLKGESRQDVNVKRSKIRTGFPRYAALSKMNTSVGGNLLSQNQFNKFIRVGQRIVYTIGHYDTQQQFRTSKEEPEKTKFDPWGVDDVRSAVDASREEADDAIQIGESYLIGTAIGICIRKTGNIWTRGRRRDCTFEIDTQGRVDVRAGNSGLKDKFSTFHLFTLQKAAIATITNNKACDVTEIGLKSKVFKQVTGFVNANSHPGAVELNSVNQDTTEGVVKRYQDENGSISLGGMNKYLMRYSFFRLQARVAGLTGAEFEYIDNGVPFGIKGNSPQPQYNFIRINHDRKEYEFRFLPYPGNAVKRNFINRNRPVRMLSSAGELLSYNQSRSGEIYQVYFKGSEIVLRNGDVSNKEWHLGNLPTEENAGKVVQIRNIVDGTIPKVTRWVEVDRRTSSTVGKQGNDEASVFYRPAIGSSSWAWGREWREYVSNRNRTTNDPLKAGEDLDDFDPYVQPYINRDGFRYGVGPHITTKGREVTRSRRGHYFGMIKYELKRADVVPDIEKNIAVSGGSGTGLTVDIKIYKDPRNNQYAAASWTINQQGSGYKDTDTIRIPEIGDFPGKNNIPIVTDFSEFVTSPWPVGKNLNPFDAIADYYLYDAERSSHQEGPEHEIVYVNEQSNLGTSPPYALNDTGIANVALRLSSSKEWNSFSQFSAYIKQGIKVKRLINNTTGATNLFPEIVYALLTENKFGLADSIGINSVDKDRMTIAAKFCEANGFYWDGVITDKQNVREFIYQNAVFNLLDFTILGGKFSLFPSVPFNSRFEIKKDQVIKKEIKALFTDGNTRNLKVSFLSPEERQNFIGTVYFRREVPNGFSETDSKTFTISPDDETVIEEKRPIEVFDMSDFCTSEKHAVEFLKHALKIREKVDHGIKFETTPQAAFGLKPGDYIRFISEITHTQRFENGTISLDGQVQSVGRNSLADVNIYHWKPGTQEVKEARLRVVNGKTDSRNLYGSVFTVKDTTESNRLYKVESITYNDEGLIELSASHAPLLSDGTLATINYIDTDFQSM